MNEALESTDIDTLRRLAVAAWQRAETLEAERGQAVEEKAQAVEEKKVVQAKYDLLVTENEALLARVAELTRAIALATNRDVQLALELELRTLRTRLASTNDLVFGSTS